MSDTILPDISLDVDLTPDDKGNISPLFLIRQKGGTVIDIDEEGLCDLFVEANKAIDKAPLPDDKPRRATVSKQAIIDESGKAIQIYSISCQPSPSTITIISEENMSLLVAELSFFISYWSGRKIFFFNKGFIKTPC